MSLYYKQNVSSRSSGRTRTMSHKQHESNEFQMIFEFNPISA